MHYPVEHFTEAEQQTLAPHFTNLDKPVFALVNLPETVKGALFARYSRYQGTLRRLYLDEFAADAEAGVASAFSGVEGQRAAELYKRIFLGYGDDSVAQLGGAHVACEWVSNVMTKVLQRGRLAAYLEQSTRYIAYDAPMPDGGYRYYRDERLGSEYESAMDRVFELYSTSLPNVTAWAAEQFPAAAGDSPAAHARAVNAKAFDLLRGLLPAGSLSHMGMFASGQAYESLILRLFASPLPEAREIGQMLLDELKQVIPSFVQRVERPDRGGEWVNYLQQRASAAQQWAARLGLDQPDQHDGRPSVRLMHVDGSEHDLAAALLFEASSTSEAAAQAAAGVLPPDQITALIADCAGDRQNRRHRPGRGFESLRYRFEIVSDYGAFRDLQRHRMLTCQWQRLSPDLGAGVPEEVDLAGAGDAYREALEVSAGEFARLESAGISDAAPYALCLGYRIRYILDMNAREAMQLIELRSGREGHPSYRAVAHEMHAQIAAVHPSVGAAMNFVDTEQEPRLERILSEMRTEAKLQSK